MSNEKIEFHQRFLDTFTIDELNDIIENAMVVTKNSIIISTEDNFFELSANESDTLDIYCDSNKDDTNKQLTKDEFMKLYKDSSLIEMQHINVDD
jgi:molecular chaperone DnaK (HSP70)